MTIYFILNIIHNTYRRAMYLPALLVILGKCWSGKLDL